MENVLSGAFYCFNVMLTTEKSRKYREMFGRYSSLKHDKLGKKDWSQELEQMQVSKWDEPINVSGRDGPSPVGMSSCSKLFY